MVCVWIDSVPISIAGSQVCVCADWYFKVLCSIPNDAGMVICCTTVYVYFLVRCLGYE